MIAYLPPVEQCRVADPRITEASGLVASDLDAGVLFTHNDSGDKARFFALGRDCRTVGTYDLKGATADDWEDVARGPDHVLWLGDIGDNRGTRRSIAVYRVAEPRPVKGSVDVDWTRYRFTYPDGAHDAETLLADPVDGRLYVLTKVFAGEAGLYAAPLPVRDGELTKVSSVRLPLVTGGDLSPDGARLVIRTYGAAYETAVPAGGSPRLSGVFAAGPGTPTALPGELQGEAVAYSPDGRSLVTVTEGDNPAVRLLGPTGGQPAPQQVVPDPERRRWPYLLGAALGLAVLLAAVRAAARRP